MTEQSFEPTHINYAIPALTHPPMYLMHKYWARKPHNVVSEYIEHYSREGEIVLDPFCGSGVTPIEAMRLGRKAVGVDLDPMAIFIASNTAIPIDIDKLREAFLRIEKQVRKRIQTFYSTKCIKCKQKVTATHYVWEADKLLRVWHNCNNCRADSRKHLEKGADRNDIKLSQSFEKKKIEYFYPQDRLIWNTRINVHKDTKVDDLFTKRNLLALAILFNAIKKEKGVVKNLLLFTFTASVAQGSKLIAYRQGLKTGGPAWTVRGLWMPDKHFELNVWHSFANKVEKIINGKTDSNMRIANYKEAKDFHSLQQGDDNILFINQSSTDLSNIPANSIDYIFTDPPYGDSVPYLELDSFWGTWLQFKPNFDDEIIISDSPERREKNFDMYSKMINIAFREVHRVLKSGHWMTVTFHNTDIQIYNAIIRAAILAGFDLEKIVYQPPAVVSAKANLAPYGSAEGDYYIRFRKPAVARTITDEKEIDKDRYERIIVEEVKKIIAERGEPTPYSVIVNSYALIYERLKEYGYLFSAPERIEEILKSQLGKDFTLIDNKWWFSNPESVPFIDMVPLHERVEKAVINVLNRKVKASFDEILREIFMTFPNALTPEVQSINSVLKEYAQKTKDKKWILKLSVRQNLSEHDTLVENLAKLGKKAGYEVYADIQGWKENELTLAGISQFSLERIKQIDCVWYDPQSKMIQYEFEVENSTGITEAIIRGANIPNKCKRFILIPKDREKLLERKLQEPGLIDKIASGEWGFIRYHDFRALYEGYKNKSKFDPKELDSLNKPPRTLEEQTDLSKFL